MLRIFFLVVFIATTLIGSAQVPIGEWRDHLPYNQSTGVEEAGNKIYCATAQSLFYYDKEDNSLNRLSKVNGLSDVGVSAFGYSESEKTLLVAYENTNIDLIHDDGTITNISDIKRKTILGQKSINSVTVVDKYAYLGCGFGIVVVDISKKEVKDTYYIANGGGQINVNDIATDRTDIYAATENGVYFASLSHPNLADFNAWTIEPNLPLGNYGSMTVNMGTFYTNWLNETGVSEDTIYFKPDDGEWEIFPHLYQWRTTKLTSSKGRLLRCGFFEVRVYGANNNLILEVPVPATPNDALYDAENHFWASNGNDGLFLQKSDGTGSQTFIPNEPLSKNVFDMSISQSELWVAPGGRKATWNNAWNPVNLYHFSEQKWDSKTSIDEPSVEEARDIVTIMVDPQDKKRVYAGSWGWGLMEFYNGKLKKTYTDQNSELHSNPLFCFNEAKDTCWVGIGGLDFDEEGNLWVVNSNSQYGLAVKRRSGSWISYNLGPQFKNEPMGELVIDSYNQKWVLMRSLGLSVFSDNNTISNKNDDRIKVLGTQPGTGDLPNKTVNAIVEDLDGEIWIGTNEGIGVFYSPELIFSNSTAADAQQILVEKDGFFQPLFGFEIVTALAVDGANRKWVRSQSAGVFLISEDGTEQIINFNEENSPLLSNNIFSIAIDDETGEVYFGTEHGIVSYKGTATKGDDVFGDVYAYPNPVRPEHDGPIAIKGLVRDADVKITDISGTLIYKTIAEGGQAIWDGTNFNGERAHTGVYLVFASNEDGSQTIVTKILFVN